LALLSSLSQAEVDLIRDACIYHFRFCTRFAFAPHLEFEDFHYDWVRFFRERREQGLWSMLLAYPGSAKTTMAHELDLAHQLLVNWWQYHRGETDIALTTLSGSHNANKAGDMTGAIKGFLLAPVITALFGNLFSYPPNWPVPSQRGRLIETIADPISADSHYNLNGLAVPGEKDFSAQAFGIDRGQAQSIHADRIKLDDMVTTNNSRTVKEREHIDVKFEADIQRALNPGGQLDVIGYAFNDADFYAKAEQKPKFKGGVIRQSWLTSNDKSTWERRWATSEVLMRREGTSPAIWLPNCQQDVKSLEGGMVRLSAINWVVPEEKPEKLPVYIGIDNNIKRKESSDYFGIFAAAFDGSNRNRWEEDLREAAKDDPFLLKMGLRETFCGKPESKDKIEIIKHLGQYFRRQGRRVKVGIEEQSGGYEMVEQVKAETDLEVEAVRAVTDKNAWLAEYLHLIESGKWHFLGPKRSDHIPGLGTFIDEIIGMKWGIEPPPPAHDDRLSGFLVANRLMPVEVIGKIEVAVHGERFTMKKAFAGFDD